MGRLGKILLLLAFLSYPVVLHIFILKEEVEISRLLFVFAPLLAVAVWGVMRIIGKAWWPLVALLLGGAVYFIVTSSYGRISLLAVNGLTHATTNLFLLWLFGRTLLQGAEPLISQVSRRVVGWMDPEVVDYTRQVTIAWCIFFALQVIFSLLLYLFAPLTAWSFFANIMNLPLIILMLVAEKTYRTANFPNHPRVSILKAIEVYSKDFAAPKKADNEH